MKNLKYINCLALTSLELQQTNGGIAETKTTVWQDVAYVGTSIFHGLAAFCTEGGKSAGISVR